METNPNAQPSIQSAPRPAQLKIFGIGTAGINVMEQLLRNSLPGASFIAVNTDAQSLASSSASEKVYLDTKTLRGLGTGGDPERGRTVAEENLSALKSLCEGAGVIFLIAGLGGGAGTGIITVLARVAKEAGALVVGFVTTPFDCEASRCQRAFEGLADLKETADAVICLPNQKVLKLVDESTSVMEAFKLTNDLLADGARGIWRLLVLPGLIPLHFEEVCSLLRDRHAQTVFATAEAMGPTRSREIIDKLVAHPLLDGGHILGKADAVLVSLVGGPDLTLVEVNRVMEQVRQQCQHAHILMGAANDESFRERLGITLIAAKKAAENPAAGPPGLLGNEALPSQLLGEDSSSRPNSRFVPPAPALPPEQVNQLLTRQSRGARARKAATKMRQGQLPLEIVSKGRFDKSEPTIHKGEDLDVPTYIRRGVPLN